MVKEIILANGQKALVDDEDYEHVSALRWFSTAKRYVATYSDRNLILLHRFILGYSGPLDVDHIDGDPLNNVRSNLRLCSRKENCRNRHGRSSHNKSSNFLGVSYCKGPRPWRAQIVCDGQVHYLGCYATEVEAAVVRDKASRRHCGKYDHLNEPSLEGIEIAYHSPRRKRFSTYVGVTRNTTGRKQWKAQIVVSGKYIYLGVYHSEYEAAVARDQAAILFYGKDARLNNPQPPEGTGPPLEIFGTPFQTPNQTLLIRSPTRDLPITSRGPR